MSNMYIKTEKGIYPEEKVILVADGITGEVFVEKMIDGYTSYLEQVITKSENLIELYDEFVCEWFDKKVNRYRHVYCSFKIGQSKELYRRDIPLPPDVDFEIYAGIWIKGKGLTYVAKMNKEGDLDPI